MSEWKEYNLGKISSMKYGTMPKKELIRDTGYPIYSGYKISGYYSTFNCEDEEIIVVARGVGGTGDVKICPPKCFVTNLSIILKVDKKIADKKYFFYKFQKHSLRYLDSGSAQSQITIDALKNLSIKLPPLEEQKQIADILSCLDNKIDNLRHQNETLEKIAQTLFKHWFIDFEFPNDEGKPYKSSGGAMVASELGDIPAGWRVGKLGEVADITSSKRIFQSEYQDSGVPFYRSKEIIELSLGQSISTELYISLEKFNEIKEKFSIPQEGDILLTSVGTIGISYIVRKNDFFYFKDGNLTWIKNFRNGFNGILIYFWLKDELTQQQIKVSTIGSTQKALTIQALNNLTLIIYNPLILSKLIPFFVSIYQKFEHNTNQIQTLTKTRDALLPKLMSGQIRIKEAESIIEEVK
jgi:type I restriction enzyme S subunit